MTRTCFALATLALSTGLALAAEPIGEWLVTDGYANIRIEKCGDQYWGVVSWEQKPGTDVNNPDPNKKNRPTLGMPVLLAMKATRPNRWDGQIYNSENGKTYTGNISLASPDVLRVEGCLLIFCGGQDWTRVKPSAPTTGRAGQPPQPRTAGAAGAPAPAPAPTQGERSAAPSAAAPAAPAAAPPGTPTVAPPATPTVAEVCANVKRRMSSAASP
jgi:uncharacterized protein (DUF2147 family)